MWLKRKKREIYLEFLIHRHVGWIPRGAGGSHGLMRRGRSLLFCVVAVVVVVMIIIGCAGSQENNSCCCVAAWVEFSHRRTT